MIYWTIKPENSGKLDGKTSVNILTKESIFPVPRIEITMLHLCFAVNLGEKVSRGQTTRSLGS